MLPFSPSNLQTRRRVYSGLKYVHVEPLRIMEGDLNASRMLSMMGAESLEVLHLLLPSNVSPVSLSVLDAATLYAYHSLDLKGHGIRQLQLSRRVLMISC